MSFIQPDFYNDIVFDLKVLSPETVSVNTTENVVTKVHFLLTGTYDGVTYEHENELEFSLENINTENLTPFSSLSESQVKAWIEDNKPMDALKHSIAIQIKDSVEASNQPSFSFQSV